MSAAGRVSTRATPAQEPRPAAGPSACNVLRTAATGSLVVAADFSAAGRPTATFTELVTRLESDVTFWETAPPPYGEEGGMTGPDHVARWERDVRASGLRVHALLGFCSGGVYAAALADRVAAWQGRPLLILLDPEVARPDMFLGHFERLVENRLAPGLEPGQVEQALRAGRSACGRHDLPLLARELAALCRRLIGPASTRLGISPDRAEEFEGLFVSYLHWLAATSELDPRPAWSGATALTSRTPGFGLEMFPPRERAGLVGRVQAIDVEHNEMMRSGAVAAAVDALLSAGPG